jgi:hypothetical protein
MIEIEGIGYCEVFSGGNKGKKDLERAKKGC